jgi:hypothetical protein
MCALNFASLLLNVTAADEGSCSFFRQMVKSLSGCLAALVSYRNENRQHLNKIVLNQPQLHQMRLAIIILCRGYHIKIAHKTK